MEHLKPNPANSTPLTPLSFLERAAIVYGDCPSIVYNNTTYTWSETHSRCLRIASAISSLGLGRGHVVSVIAPNVPATYELHFAVPMSGAVLNTINIRLDPRTISILLCHSESRLVFVDRQFAPLVLHALSFLPSDHPRPLLVLISDHEADKKITPSVSDEHLQLIFQGHSRTSDETIKTNQVEHLYTSESELGSENSFFTTYENMVQKGDPKFKWITPKSEWDPIVLNYTSGTTSSPKGVVHCHRGIFLTSINTLIDWGVHKQPIYLWTLPMFHANGWCYPWAMAAIGGTNICLRKFDATTIYAAIHSHHVTHMCAAPIVLNMLTNINPNPNPNSLPHPVHILTSGSSPPATVLERAESLGFIVTHGFGMTETAGCIISCAWKPQWDRFPATERARLKARQGVRTIGMAHVDVINPTSGKPVEHDGETLGEIVVQGGSIMLGYLKDPEATSKCMGKDGWLRTGDLGVIYQDGYLQIRDRSKDIIISGGENISSVEVESILYTFPGVNEVAVVARPHEHWGETPCAFISFMGGVTAKTKTKTNKEIEREIIEYCREKMAHYMVPKTVVIMEELPKTSTGKIQKFVLREMVKSLGVDRDTTKTTSKTSRL